MLLVWMTWAVGCGGGDDLKQRGIQRDVTDIEDCGDLADNDRDGLFDCDDDDCADDPECSEADGDTDADADADTDADADADTDSYTAAHGGTMVKVAAHTFEMGCTAGMSGCDSDESPAHSVTLSNDFFMGETEVTQGEYEAMMGTNPSLFDTCGTDCPVERVSWHMSASFANAVSDAEGLEHCYTCSGTGTSADCAVGVNPYSCEGYRMATEAEWEGAARCGEDTLYSGSDSIDEVAWYQSNSGGSPQAVGTKAANGCGLFDMSGNIWEWTQDRYSSSYYGDSPDTDPVGPSSGSNWVNRGGSWVNGPSNGRVADRDKINTSYQDDDLGFRLARTSH